MAKTIPTAKDFLRDNVYITKDGVEDVHDSLSDVAEKMIEFTKLHLAEQKRKILKNARIRMNDESMVIAFGKKFNEEMYSGIIDEHSITNAYHFKE